MLNSEQGVVYTTTAQKQSLLLWMLIAALAAGCGFMFWKLANRISRLDIAIAGLVSKLDYDRGHEVANLVESSLARSSARVQPKEFNSSSAEDISFAVQRIHQMKQRKTFDDPISIAATLNNSMAAEPALPRTELQQLRWLDDTLKQMSDDSPDASNLQTSCAGRRCLVSATFASDDDARAWSASYTNASGGKLLKRAKTVVVPLGGANESVALQVYFY